MQMPLFEFNGTQVDYNLWPGSTYSRGFQSLKTVNKKFTSEKKLTIEFSSKTVDSKYKCPLCLGCPAKCSNCKPLKNKIYTSLSHFFKKRNLPMDYFIVRTHIYMEDLNKTITNISKVYYDGTPKDKMLLPSNLVMISINDLIRLVLEMETDLEITIPTTWSKIKIECTGCKFPINTFEELWSQLLKDPVYVGMFEPKIVFYGETPSSFLLRRVEAGHLISIFVLILALIYVYYKFSIRSDDHDVEHL